jgi:hypothetical protein
MLLVFLIQHPIIMKAIHLFFHSYDDFPSKLTLFFLFLSVSFAFLTAGSYINIFHFLYNWLGSGTDRSFHHPSLVTSTHLSLQPTKNNPYKRVIISTLLVPWSSNRVKCIVEKGKLFKSG